MMNASDNNLLEYMAVHAKAMLFALDALEGCVPWFSKITMRARPRAEQGRMQGHEHENNKLVPKMRLWFKPKTREKIKVARWNP